jgi:Type I restriction modification DNA specificity domain
MTITGNVGRVVYLGDEFGEANINQHIARIRIIDAQVTNTFVFHFLSQPLVQRYYNLITTGQAYPQISLTQVRETEVPMPSLAEQIAIADILTDIDLEIAALERKLTKARRLKQGMMQELLTGRVRLVRAPSASPSASRRTGLPPCSAMNWAIAISANGPTAKAIAISRKAFCRLGSSTAATPLPRSARLSTSCALRRTITTARSTVTIRPSTACCAMAWP